VTLTRSAATATLILDSCIAFNISPVRAATPAGTAPAVAPPAANRVASRTVGPTNPADMPAAADSRASVAARPPAESLTPRRARRFAALVLAPARRPDPAPTGQPG